MGSVEAVLLMLVCQNVTSIDRCLYVTVFGKGIAGMNGIFHLLGSAQYIYLQNERVMYKIGEHLKKIRKASCQKKKRRRQLTCHVHK